jgi:hypothetical protein
MHVSLEALQEREYRLTESNYDPCAGLDPATGVDRYMELNDGRMGEDSEELALREKRTRKLLSERPLPSYSPL